jgi:ubiquinone/menaquinone biosynthesis C-methylase UbiE
MTDIRAVRRELSVRLCLGLGRICRAVFGFEEPEDLQASAHDQSYFARRRAASAAILGRFPPLAGLEVLEIGCGHGGMLEALRAAEAIPQGIDPDARRVQFAQDRGLPAKIAVAEQLPFPDQSFDAVISDEVIEHLHDVDSALGEAFRVLRPGGYFYSVWGPAWLTYNGPHLIKCLSVPWVQLFFSDRTIVEALRRQRNRGQWPTSYLDYKIEDFQAMGRVTRARLRRAAHAAGFAIEREESHSRHPIKQWLSKVRPFDELLAGELVVALRRPADA